jgi:type IV pilus assembly protein PilQ
MNDPRKRAKIRLHHTTLPWDFTPKARPFFSSMLSVCAACAVLALPVSPAAGADEADEPTSDVNVTTYGTVDLHVQDTDLAQVLQMLSMQSQKNIITSRSVSATVTANLYDVTFDEALAAILHVNGYDYIEEGNFIYIYTQQEIEEIRRAQRLRESRIFILEHLSAADAREFTEPLLSSDGRISHRGDVRAGFKPDINDGGADEYAYSAKIVVNDFAENLDAIAELLRELDTPPQQVLVEATVLRSRLFEDNAFGIDFSVLGRVDFSDFFTPFSAVDDLLFKGQPETEVENTVGSPATAETGHRPQDGRARALTSRTTASGGLKVGVMHDNVSVFLRVLDEVTDSTVLARPKIMALNRQRAEVLVGEKVAYRSSTATETSVTQRVEFLDTGVSLSFRPFISRNGMIRLELQPKVSFATLRDTGDGDTLPDEFTNELTTNVRVRDGQTLVLGGLFEEDIQKTRRQIPFLGDVPLLGAVFRGHEDRVRRNEIIFLITPTIINDDVLWELGRDSLAMVEAAQVGARHGLLPFSREKITGHYNQMAINAMQQGNNRRARYYINNSLRLKSDQPEMIRLRQQVTGKEETTHERGLLERILRNKLSMTLDGDDDETPITAEATDTPMLKPEELLVDADDPDGTDDPDADADAAGDDDVLLADAHVGGPTTAEKKAAAQGESAKATETDTPAKAETETETTLSGVTDPDTGEVQVGRWLTNPERAIWPFSPWNANWRSPVKFDPPEYASAPLPDDSEE